MILLLLVSIWFENPRILSSSDSIKLTSQDSLTYTKKTSITVNGEKSIYLQGTGGSGDIFQSTNILISGKTSEGWTIHGYLYDNRLYGSNDIYTISLKDANTAYIVIKRHLDSFILGRFSIYGNRLDGGYFGVSHNTFNLRGGIGQKKGEETLFDTIIKPPYYNVPIKISQKGIPIIERSERVFIDNTPLDRTQYRLDYNRGILYLHINDNAPLHRLLVTYQYHTPYTAPYVYTIGGTLKGRYFEVNTELYKEKLSERIIVDSLGGVFYRDGGGDYEKKDSIFVYAGDGQGHYMVYFIYDTLNGSYDYVSEGDYYTFVGRGNGHYSPAKVTSPSLLNYNNISVKAGKSLYLRTTYHLSQSSKNGKDENGNGIEVSIGVKNRYLSLEAGLRKTHGIIYLPYPAYNKSQNSYKLTLEDEKFVNLTCRYRQIHSQLYSTIDSIPHWNVTLGLNAITLKLRGENHLNESELFYRKKTATVSLYYNSPLREKFIGIGMNLPHIPTVHVFLEEDTLFRNYGILLSHTIGEEKNHIHFDFFKTRIFLTYTISSELEFKKGNIYLKLGRTIDMNNLYIERFVKTSSGTFIYDSVSDIMLPSEFGDYNRMLIPITTFNSTYRNIASVALHIKPHNSTLNTRLQLDNTSNEKKLKLYSSISLPFMYGTIIRSNLMSQTILTDISQVNLHSVSTYLSALTKKKISPGLVYNYNKDDLSGFEKKEYGGFISIKSYNILNTARILRGNFLPFEKSFYIWKNQFGLILKRYTFNLETSYSSSSKVPYSTYLKIGASYDLKLNSLSNTFTINGIFTRDLPPRWKVEGSIKF